ncbi:MAG: APC family permease [Candidatus Eisenbacteria bacterium]|nr:APC family permease [Candidatus Eisenbacteria bacterium]
MPSDSGPFPDDEGPGLHVRVWRKVIGPPRDLGDRSIYQHIALAAFLAWVGLGADGLSSSSYGPSEAFRVLGAHRYLAIGLALLTAFTVIVIAIAFRRIVEAFPHGGGGYLVATKLLGKRAGVVSGCALLVDYMLTITVSIAAAGDALFSLLPLEWQVAKLPAEVLLILVLVLLNLRGVRESVMALLPIFLLFVITHVVLILGAIALHWDRLPSTAVSLQSDFQVGLQTLGWGGMLLLFLHAYSLGGGTYTGLEAVSNGLPVMREPRVATARRTMSYMAASLSFVAGGLILAYLLWDVRFIEGRTINAVLTESFSSSISLGHWFVVLTLVSEGALLVVGAQGGLIAGPRVLANMASDSWFPRRFASLSERLTTQNGILLMGVASLLALFYTGGEVRHLVVMYSINVFLTFSLAMLGMLRDSIARAKRRDPAISWKRDVTLFVVGFLLCATILVITTIEKFREGGWLTIAVTGGLVILCFAIQHHYGLVGRKLAALFRQLANIPRTHVERPASLDQDAPTAVVLVGTYGGLGIHTFLNSLRLFPGYFRNVVFVSAGVIDSGAFKGVGAVEELRAQTEHALQQYVTLAEGFGVPAAFRLSVGTDVVNELEHLCLQIAKEFPRSIFFAGKILFERERWYQHLLHNETAFAVQKRLQWAEKTMVILPARVR